MGYYIFSKLFYLLLDGNQYILLYKAKIFERYQMNSYSYYSIWYRIMVAIIGQDIGDWLSSISASNTALRLLETNSWNERHKSAQTLLGNKNSIVYIPEHWSYEGYIIRDILAR